MSTKSLRCVISTSDNFASCNEHWRTRLHTLWYEPLFTTRLITVTVFWLPVEYLTEKLQSVPVLPPGLFYDCPVARPFPRRCGINFTGWASSQEWSSSWLSWLTSRYMVWPRVPGLPTVFRCRACQGRSHRRSADQWTMFVLEPRLWQSALRVFTVRALASGNTLPVSLRDFNLSLENFRGKLKLHLFIS